MNGKESTKTSLLDAGKRLFLERGYNNSGIDAIVKEVGVPKGSFYHYFDNKEDFGLQVLNRFAEAYDLTLDRYLNDQDLSPLERLRLHFEAIIARLESQECRRGCLVGNLSQEMADQSEAFRSRLEEIFEGWVDRLASCLQEAREAGALPARRDVRELAEFWLNSWQGAVLRAKTMRDTAPLRTFLNMIFDDVLQT